MAITSLKQTKWLFNEAFASCAVEPDATINFKSNNVDYTRFDLMINPIDQSVFVIQYINNDTSVTAYSTSGWGNQEYRTITIVDGDDVENTTLIAFLEANATQLEYDLEEPEVPEDKPLEFQETNINLDIYENLTAKDYEALEKKEHALYIVKDVGIYKGTKLIARNEDVTKLGLEKVLNLYIRNESVTDITNLTDAIIQFNDTVDLPMGTWEIRFNSINNYNDTGYWGEMEISRDYMTNQLKIAYAYISSQTETSTTWSAKTVYQNGQWVDRAYQTIAITGGDEVQDSDLIEALISNSSISVPQSNKYQLNVYEISSLDEFHLIRKDPNAFYLVANSGVYKGSVLIASSTSEDYILSLLDTTVNNKIQVSINDDETIDLIIN